MTPIERVQSIANGLVDGVATTNQITALVDAYVYFADDVEVLASFGTTKANLTNNQKLLLCAITMNREQKAKVIARKMDIAQIAGRDLLRAASTEASEF